MNRCLGYLMIAGVVSCFGCYKSRTVLPSQQRPEYETYIVESSRYHSGTSKLDSTAHVFELESDTLYPPHFFFDFRLLSGSPAEYVLTAYVVDLPAGLTLSFDTLSFRLNYHYDFGVNPGSFRGVHTSYLHIYNPDLGLKVYPLTFDVK